MSEKISKNVNEWQWRYTHVNEYANKPWSMTKLKPLFHRETQVGGNQNTPQVSKYKMSRTLETNLFMGDHTPNYKMIVEFGASPSQDVNLMSIDTGMSENIFGGHYFDMNERHLKGDLPAMETDFKKLERGGADNKPMGYVLRINPISTKKIRKVKPIEEALVDEYASHDNKSTENEAEK